MVTEWFGVFVVIKDLTCVKTVKDKIKIKKKNLATAYSTNKTARCPSRSTCLCSKRSTLNPRDRCLM